MLKEYETKDWKMMDEDFNRNDLDKIFNEIVKTKPIALQTKNKSEPLLAISFDLMLFSLMNLLL